MMYFSIQLLKLVATCTPLHSFMLCPLSDRSSTSTASSVACFLAPTGNGRSGISRNDVPFFATLDATSTTEPSTSTTTTKKPSVSVYEKAHEADHIKLTDYLRSPRILKAKEEPAKADAPKEMEQKASVTAVPLPVSDIILDEAISTFDAPAAQRILSKLADMRRVNLPDRAIATFLDELLERGPDSAQSQPQWARLRPLARFSRRARLASLRRTLDLVTPPISASEGEVEEDEESKKRRRRRAFVSVLNTLAKPLDDDESSRTKQGRRLSVPAIVILERKARQEQQQSASSEDMISRRPSNLETPDYTVVAKRSAGYEIRHYEPYSLCSVNMAKARPPDSYKTDATISEPKLRGASSFGALAGYLFGKNQDETAMKMTTPVFTTNMDTDTATSTDATESVAANQKMSFVLPSEYWKDDTSLATAPKPLEGSGVTLERIEGGDRAVVMFGGYATKENVAQRKQELLKQLESDPEWQVASSASSSSSMDNDAGGFALAQYNDPFTPPWKRLNDISIAVEMRRH